MSSFNGSGTFQISGVGLPYTPATTISSSVANQLNIDIATGLSTCITRDGQSVITANIGWNNYNINNLSAIGIGTASPAYPLDITNGDARINGVTVGIGSNNDYTNTTFGLSAAPTGTANCQCNVAFGTTALYANLDGYDLTAVGFSALNANTVGIDNTAIGSSAGYSLTGYSQGNTFIGSQVATSATGGNYNTAVGSFSFTGSSSTTGSSNSILGAYSGTTITTGYSNTILGYNSNPSSATGNNQIVIGALATGQGDNYVTIGKGGTNQIYAQFTTSATWTKASDERIKKNIQDSKLGLEFVSKLRPVTYNWKPNNEYPKEIIGYDEKNTQDLDAVMHGLIAQEVKSALDAEGVEHFAGWSQRESDGLQGVSNDMFVLPLINAVKELKARLELAEAKLAKIEG
jgi:hypothetical protein